MPSNSHGSRGKPARFLAIDGEAVTSEDGRHYYVMLCASDGSYVENADGLSAVECLEYLLGLKRNYPERTVVGFAFNYDVNMMLKGMKADGSTQGACKVDAQILWKDRKACLVLDSTIYEIDWIPTKSVRICSDVTVQIWDAFGFFQSSFLIALRDWMPEVTEQLDIIEQGKAGRATFSVEDMPAMRAYCIAECELLAELMGHLQDALREAGLNVSAWNGAGAVASAMLRKYDVLSYHKPDYELAPELLEAVMYAYAGGRFEMYRQGRFDQCYNYDIISAYPYECLALPVLAKGRWEKRKRYDATKPHALWLVSWDVPHSRKIMPFPVRHKGNMYYPFEGKAWVWAHELAAALAMHPEIKIEAGYVFTPASDVQPFAFVAELFEKRREAKRLGLASQKAYKLGLNSLYGKLAQGRGYQGRIPRQRSFVWAGMITSGTRARLLEMMLGQEDNVIAVATDGVFYEDDPGLPVGSDLGELEVSVVPEFYQLMNGIYYSPNAKIRTRGHSPKELNWEHITAIWDEEKFEGVYNYTTKRFVGLGQALLRKDFSSWGCWVEAPRKLLLAQHFRKYLSDEAFADFESGTFESENYSWYPLSLDGIKLGEPYQPKTDVTSRQSPKEKDELEDYIRNWEYLDQPTVEVAN